MEEVVINLLQEFERCLRDEKINIARV